MVGEIWFELASTSYLGIVKQPTKKGLRIVGGLHPHLKGSSGRFGNNLGNASTSSVNDEPFQRLIRNDKAKGGYTGDGGVKEDQP